jgi:hypothetical protein
MDDPMPKVSEVAVGQYSAAFLQAIDRGLALKPKDRPQSVAEFRALMDDPFYVAPPSEPAVTAPVDFDLTLETPLVAQAATGLRSAASGSSGPTRQRSRRTDTGRQAGAQAWQALPATARGGSRQRLSLLVAALALLALLGLGYSLYRDSRPAAPEAADLAPASVPASVPAASCISACIDARSSTGARASRRSGLSPWDRASAHPAPAVTPPASAPAVAHQTRGDLTSC